MDSSFICGLWSYLSSWECELLHPKSFVDSDTDNLVVEWKINILRRKLRWTVLVKWRNELDFAWEFFTLTNSAVFKMSLPFYKLESMVPCMYQSCQLALDLVPSQPPPKEEVPKFSFGTPAMVEVWGGDWVGRWPAQIPSPSTHLRSEPYWTLTSLCGTNKERMYIVAMLIHL